MINNKILWKLNTFIILALLILIISSINVNALGVAPSKKIVDYMPGEQTYTIRILNNENKDMNVMVYFQGELGEYATIEKNIISVGSNEPEKSVTFKVNIPSGLTPGTKKLDVMMLELGDNIDTDKIDLDKTMIFSTVLVVHQLRINVPYPGVFAEGVLYISEANVDETMTFTVNVLNKGTSAISNINGEVIIRGPTNEEIRRIKTGTISSIASGQAEKLSVNMQTDINPGLYSAEFIVNYNDKQFVLRKTFTVDEMSVDIRSIELADFKLGYISRVDIDVLNRWNQPMPEAYAYLQVLNEKGEIISETKTASSILRQLTTTTLSGYWDTKGVNVGSYDMKVILYYNDKSQEKLFKAVIGIDDILIADSGTTGLVIGNKEKDTSIPILYILVVVLLFINGFLVFVYFKYIRKKNPPQNNT